MLSLDPAYRSLGGEVEASSPPTICRLPDSRRHQLSAIALELLLVTLSALLSLITPREVTDRNGIRLIRSWRSAKCWRTGVPNVSRRFISGSRQSTDRAQRTSYNLLDEFRWARFQRCHRRVDF